MTTLLENKKARHEYEFLDTFVAGMVLSGPEVKSLRLKHGSLQGSFVRVIDGELWVVNMMINPYSFSRNEDYEPTRSRKLLVKKHELLQLQEKQNQKGIALVPSRVVAAGRHVKLEIAIARGKQLHDKREAIRKRDLDRAARKDAKYSY